ncbi:hypothetical protein F5Y00DRAFT_266568 [Daldinia vernicosa]|uniref:uncharacterized protein n=1 Tax=Daldinia vernicosa TaxID=114800 RepID=UPI002007E722|nr:uncharacterized protein F5Y00DRAFT_266568 [Daldinia vernicosa]KAI0844410.1 hypothetical protein F5Y00DRAFT_266568 [Daldinia vernicosa]
MAYQDNQAARPFPRLALYGDHRSEIDRAILNILNTCVGPPYGLLGDASVALDNLRPPRRRRHLGESLESESTFLYGFWRTFLEFASQIPCDDPAQGYLAMLINELRTLHPPNELGVNIWRDLPGLQRGINDAWREPTRYEYDHQLYKQWVNLNAFTSRIYYNDLLECYGLGIRAMRRAFEDDQSHGGAFMTCRVKAAAQWMIYSADKLFSLMTTRPPSEEEQIDHMSPLFYGINVFSPARWAFWKRRFRNLSGATKKAADAAVENMNRADGGQPV